MSEFIISTTNMPEHVMDAAVAAWTKEEIVRCRDCAYICNREYANGLEFHTCSYFDSEHSEVELDGFCAWGERRGA